MRKIVIAILFAILAAFVAGCATSATPSAALPAPPIVTTVHQFGQPFEAVPGVTVTITAQHVQVPLGVTGAEVPGARVKITYANHTDQPLAAVAPIYIRISDLDGNMAVFAASVVGEPISTQVTKGVSEVYPGHTGTLIATVNFTTPWTPDQPISVIIPAPVPTGQTPNPFERTATAVGVVER